MLFLVLIGVFLVLGVVLYSGRGAAMIAGYNTLPRSERAKYDEHALARFMGKMMFAWSFSMLFWALGALLGPGWLFAVGFVLFCGIMAFALIYANTGNRFRKVQTNGEGGS